MEQVKVMIWRKSSKSIALIAGVNQKVDISRTDT